MENIQDSNVVSFGLIVQEMRNEITNLIIAFTKQATSKPMRLSNYVSLLILFRMKECMTSVEILISKGLERDAATLILTLIELRLDMQYIALDYKKNAKDWIDHDEDYKKPWKVGILFKELFPNKNERDREKECYRNFSMIKHGNPFGGTISFPIGVKDEWLVVNEKSNSNMQAPYIFAEGIECHGILKAAIKDFSDAGFDIKSNEIAIESLNSKLLELNHEHVNKCYLILNEIIAPE